MKCPFCLADNDRVTDSRPGEDGVAIRRRRECSVCKRRYTTSERVDEIGIRVLKKDNRRQAYKREKIRQGLAKACGKRPITDLQIDAVVSTIECAVYDNFDSEIESSRLGEMVMEHLADLDDVAYVRFASVYRRFKNIHDFMKQLQPMLERKDFQPEEPIEQTTKAAH